jgi:hypothetical protein
MISVTTLRRVLVIFASIAILVMTLALAAGCGNPRPVTAVVGVDASASGRASVGGWAYLATRLMAALDAEQDRLYAFRLDSRLHPVHEGAPLRDDEAMRAAVVAALETVSGERGTAPETFLTTALARARRDPGVPVLVVLFTDGHAEAEGKNAASRFARIRASAAQLAACPDIRRVLVLGIAESRRTDWRAALTPLGARAEIIARPARPQDGRLLLERLSELRRGVEESEKRATVHAANR